MREAEHGAPSAQGSFSPRVRAALVVLLAVPLARALVGASTKALVQDEFHTRFHASAASLAELFANLRLDNPPRWDSCWCASRATRWEIPSSRCARR